MPGPEDIPVVGAFVQAQNDLERDHIPIFGEVWRSMNAVIDFVEYGCYPTWTVWVDTLLPALGTAIIQLFDFGLGDILRGYFRPTNLRGIGRLGRFPVRGRKGKGGKLGKLRRFPQPPEVGDSIGKRLPGSKMFRARKVTGIERQVWVIDQTVQRALWYWLMADIAENFITNWTTAIMESEACRNTDLGHCSADRLGNQPMAPDEWQAIINWHVISNEPSDFFGAGSGSLSIPDGMKARITFMADTHAILPNTSTGNQIRVGHVDESYFKNITTPWPVGEGDDPQKTCLTGTIVGPAFVQAMVKPFGTGIQFCSNAKLTAQLVPV